MKTTQVLTAADLRTLASIHAKLGAIIGNADNGDEAPAPRRRRRHRRTAVTAGQPRTKRARRAGKRYPASAIPAAPVGAGDVEASN